MRNGFQEVRSILGKLPRRSTTIMVAIALGATGFSVASAAPTSSPVTLFGNAKPIQPADADTNSVVLGVRFSSASDGVITALRFYKSAQNTGTHTGTLWTSDGRMLSQVTFRSETASGWQSAKLANPVHVSAGNSYVASYVAPHGRYADDTSRFNVSYRAAPLAVPANGGVYAYGSGGFPTQTWQSSNYYVDVTFSTTSTSATSLAPNSTTTTKPSPTTSTTIRSTTTSTTSKIPATTSVPRTTTTTARPTPAPATPASFSPGNPNGNATIPTGMGLENVSRPDHVVGAGTPASCTSAAVLSAVSAGGVITFNCGPNPTTITLTETARVKNSTAKLVLDGGGLVTLSGGGKDRIIYVDTCDGSLGAVSGNCLYAPTGPQVTVQNITLADGNATNATYVSPGDGPNGGSNGGGAILQLGGRLKVVKSVFTGNQCASNGPDLGGGAIRVLAQHSDTPNDLDGSSAARGQYPAYVVQSTFGGAPGKGNSCSNGGAISTLRTPLTVLNSVMSYNSAVGCCANPAWSGTPGGGSGGAFYSDGDTYDMTINGSSIQNNTAKAGGSSIFFVSNDLSGHLKVLNSVSSNNTYAANGQPNNAHFENNPGMFYLGSGKPDFSGSTIR